MRVVLFGATGMVGQGVLRECLLDPDVETVLTVGRNATGQRHERLREIVQADLFDLSPIETELSGFDACFFCLGVSSAGMTEKSYRPVTYDLTISVARTLAKLNPRIRSFTSRAWHGQHRAGARHVGAREGRDRERAARDAFQGRLHVPSGADRAPRRDPIEDEALPGSSTRRWGRCCHGCMPSPRGT